jgi:hypothetical protein
MTHDPLCFQSQGKWDGGCQCDLIARVRADERAQVVRDVTDEMDRLERGDPVPWMP